MVENIVAVLATAPSALGLGFGSSKNITNAIMRALAHAHARRFMAMHRTHPCGKTLFVSIRTASPTSP